MGMFKGQGCEFKAHQAGLAIFQRIDETNKRLHWKYPNAMSTKIGIHSGDVWIFDCGEYQMDPQGTTVDVAARLTSIATSDHIICSSSTLAQAKALDSSGVLSGIAEHEVTGYVKGIKESLELTIITPEGKKLELGTFFLQPAPKSEKLARAMQFVRRKEYSNAMAQYEDILKDRPNDFHANICLGELLIKDELLYECNYSEDRLKKALELLNRAKWIRPASCRVWLLLAWLYYRWYGTNNNLDMLRKAIDHARKALDRAEDHTNSGSILLAKADLARYLLELSKKSDNKVYLEEAHSICDEMQEVVDNVFDECKSDYYATFAAILIERGIKDFERIKDFISKADTLNPDNYRVSEVEALLKRKRHTSSWTGGPFS